VARVSRRLKRLIERERVLRGNLLGDSKSWSTPPTDREIDLALAYRVLMHAEIERYLEETVVATLASSQHIYDRLASFRVPALAAIAVHQSLRLSDGAKDAWTDVRAASVAREMPTALMAAISWVETSIIGSNNGVKPRDVSRLMGHVGIARRDLDPTLLDALEIFGGERGDAAHLSRREIAKRLHRGSPPGAPKVRRLASPSDEVSRVVAVLSLLPQLDRQVAQILREPA
jgi:hypothetical protein